MKTNWRDQNPLEGFAITRLEAQWLLGASPAHLQKLEQRVGVPGKPRGYTLGEFEHLSRMSQGAKRIRSGGISSRKTSLRGKH